MRFLLSAALLLAFSSSVLGQRLLLMSPDSSYLQRAGLLSTGLNFEASSNALTTTFIRKMGLGGYIGERTKEAITGELEDMNRVGMHLGFGVAYRSFDAGIGVKNEWGWQCGLSSRASIVGGFSRDAFQLAMLGNAAYLGESAEFDQTRAQAIQFQKASFGVFHKRNFSFVQVSLVNGQSYQQVQVDEASLYTSAFADTLVLNYQGSFLQSDTASNGFGSSNGLGLALDAAYSVPFEDGSGYMTIGVEDIGHVWWSAETLTSSADSSFTWTGVDFGQVTSETSFNFPTLEDTLYYQQSKAPERAWLPARIYASVMRRTQGNDFWFASASIRPDGHQLPLVAGGYGYFANDQTLWTFSAQAGGYGRLAVGAGLEKTWGPIYLHLEIPDLPGLVMRNHHGLAGRLRFGYFLNATPS